MDHFLRDKGNYNKRVLGEVSRKYLRNVNDFLCLLHFIAYNLLRVLVHASSEFVTYAMVILSAAPGEERSNITAEGAQKSLNSESAFEHSLQRARGTRSSMRALGLGLSITGGNGVLACW